MIRIGQGIDVHGFEPGDHLVLGGVIIPFHQAFKAHSDGDVLLHALCDALLGALALGDIGQHFPDTDLAYKGADSRTLLRAVFKLVQEQGYVIGNIDNTVMAEAPKLKPHIPQINANIAEDLQCDIAQVSTKATTTEKLGFVGRGEGIAAFSTVLLTKQVALQGAGI